MEIKKIDVQELKSMSNGTINVSVYPHLVVITTDGLKYGDQFLIDRITSIKRCGNVVSISIPGGTFMGDRKVKIDFDRNVIATEKETFSRG